MGDDLRLSPLVSGSFEAFASSKGVEHHKSGGDRVIGQFVTRICTLHAATYRP